MPTATRKCCGCKSRFDQGLDAWTKQPAGWFHNFECLFEYANKKRERIRNKRIKAEKKENVRKKREFYDNDRRHQIKRTQAKVNAYIRARDKDKDCISCSAKAGTFRLTAGHYKTSGAHPELTFNEKNIHGQCWWNCNSNKSGNLVGFRLGLVARYGREYVEYLESYKAQKNYTIDNLKTIYRWYDRKLKRLKRAQSIK